MAGVMLTLLALVGVAPKLMNDADGTRFEATDGRREDEERNREGLRLGEYGAGVPGCTSATHAVMAAIVAERRRPKGGRTGLAGA